MNERKRHYHVGYNPRVAKIHPEFDKLWVGLVGKNKGTVMRILHSRSREQGRNYYTVPYWYKKFVPEWAKNDRLVSVRPTKFGVEVLWVTPDGTFY